LGPDKTLKDQAMADRPAARTSYPITLFPLFA